MRSSPSISPALPDDQDVYLVLDDGAPFGRCWRETTEERTERGTVMTDLLDGQYSNPLRVVVFNTSEGSSRDVSEEFAELIAHECASDGFDVPPFLRDFVDRHRRGWPAQLPLPLRRKV